MSDDEQKEMRSLAAWFTSLGSRVIWDSDQQVRSIAVFGEGVQDKHLSDLRRFTNLADLNLTRSPVTDAGMFYVGKLVQLKSLLLGGTVISDEGLEQLQKLTNLKSLNLIRTGATDDGLRYFSEATSLEALWLECTDITDRGLEVLSCFPKLALLDVGNTAVTDEGLAAVSRLQDLEEISVAACEGVQGPGLRHLSGLSRLTHLFADNCSVGDEVLPYIRHLPLQVLSLNWTEVTDDGLPFIAGIPSLQELHLIGSRVSPEAADDFRSRHPDCVVHHAASRSDPNPYE